jgi:hypothetical protein
MHEQRLLQDDIADLNERICELVDALRPLARRRLYRRAIKESSCRFGRSAIYGPLSSRSRSIFCRNTAKRPKRHPGA